MKKKNTVYFDMDGTFYNLYGFENWLNCILSENTDCYTKGKLLVEYSEFYNTLLELKGKGYKLGIITWLSKDSTRHYQNMVRNAKIRYLKKHFNNIFDIVHIIQYGKNKSVYCEENDILFDDEENNRIQWIEKKGISYDVKNIIEIMKSL